MQLSIARPKLILAFLIILNFVTLPARMGIFNASSIILAVAGLIILIINIYQRSMFWQQIKQTHFLTLYALLMIPMLISNIDALNTQEAWKTTASFLRYGLAFFVIIYVCKERYWQLCLWHAVMFILLFWCIDALWQWQMSFNFLGAPLDTGAPYYTSRLTGIFAPKFHLGYMLATLSPIYFEWLRVFLWPKSGIRYLCLPLFILLILVVFLSGARSAWLTLGIAMMLWLMVNTYLRQFSFKTMMLLALTFALVAGVSLNLPSLQQRVALTTKVLHSEKGAFNEASALRVELWKAAHFFWINHPVNGIGPGGFQQAYQQLPDTQREQLKEGFHPHWHGLEILAESGSIGFIAYVIMYISLLYLLLTAKRGREWLMSSVLALFPMNMHVAFYGSLWAPLIFLPLAIGLVARSSQ